jgi:hypothetical protein
MTPGLREIRAGLYDGECRERARPLFISDAPPTTVASWLLLLALGSAAGRASLAT